MKIFITIIIISGILIQSCDFKSNELNCFSSSSDTLTIRTEKNKGRGPFISSYVPITFEDFSNESMKQFIVPSNLLEIKSLHLSTNYADNNPDYIDIISGLLDDKEIFIVDENNNNNFQDDSVRLFPRLKWDSHKGHIKCRYHRTLDNEVVEDSTWIQLRLDQNDVLWFGKKEHLTASLSIDNEQYILGATDLFRFDFKYSPRTWISVLSENGATKDTLFESDILKIGESLKIGQYYYRFENITNTGKYITLIKETDFNNTIGLQEGMIAPEFECVTVSSDTIKSSTLHDRLLIIANSCGCGGDIESIEAYYHILERYGDKIHIFRLDSEIDKSLEGYQIDMNNEFNKELYQKYRNEYCSRTCFVINKKNRIIDRFPSQDWKLFLPKLIDK